MSHTFHAVVFNTDVLGGITAQTIRTGTTVRSEARSGEVYARNNYLVGQLPGAEFTTENIAAALALCGLTGTDIDGLGAGLNLYAHANADGATRAGAGGHRKYTMVDGIVVPRRLTCEHRGDASLSYEAFATYDGTNDPLQPVEAQDLPAGLTDSERFTLGPIQIGDVTIDEEMNLDIDFGIQVTSEGWESGIWDTRIYIATIQPTITLRGINTEWFKATNIPLTGKAATHANTAIYLRKRADGGTFVADAEEEHIKITAAGMAWIDTPFEGRGGSAETSLVFQTKYDGTNAPLTIDTTSVLPS